MAEDTILSPVASLTSFLKSPASTTQSLGYSLLERTPYRAHSSRSNTVAESTQAAVAPWLAQETKGRIVVNSKELMKELFSGLGELVTKPQKGRNLGDEDEFAAWWAEKVIELPADEVGHFMYFNGQ